MVIRPRAVTPGAFLLLCAFVLLLLSCLSPPITRTFPLGSVGDVKFGVFGSCTGNTCTPVGLGYDMDSAFPSSAEPSFTLPASIRNVLTHLLVLHLVSTGWVLLTLILAASAHIRSPAHSMRFMLALVMFSVLGTILSLVTFLVDLIAFMPNTSTGSFLTIAASALNLSATIALCVARKLVGRRKNRQRLAEDQQMIGPSFFDAKHQNLQDESRMNNSWKRPSADLPKFAEFTVNDDPKESSSRTLTPDRVPLKRGESRSEISTPGENVNGIVGYPQNYHPFAPGTGRNLQYSGQPNHGTRFSPERRPVQTLGQNQYPPNQYGSSRPGPGLPPPMSRGYPDDVPLHRRQNHPAGRMNDVSQGSFPDGYQGRFDDGRRGPFVEGHHGDLPRVPYPDGRQPPYLDSYKGRISEDIPRAPYMSEARARENSDPGPHGHRYMPGASFQPGSQGPRLMNGPPLRTQTSNSSSSRFGEHRRSFDQSRNPPNDNELIPLRLTHSFSNPLATSLTPAQRNKSLPTDQPFEENTRAKTTYQVPAKTSNSPTKSPPEHEIPNTRALDSAFFDPGQITQTIPQSDSDSSPSAKSIASASSIYSPDPGAGNPVVEYAPLRKSWNTSPPLPVPLITKRSSTSQTHSPRTNYYEDVDPRFDTAPGELDPGPQSPGAASNSSHFTSVSQRPVNPRWQPSGPQQQPLSDPPPSKHNDVLFQGNPDFEVPLRNPHGKRRGLTPGNPSMQDARGYPTPGKY
ncbi:pH-response regulator protein palI/prr-5 [Neolecta irregularis DAH-3]|uniref:pH-response regulator protein palI/prr-5 n=1 Tax=Neolecta irregularis (strain DAH-3) TaxID=1198029 RepID=A0A1U7LH82_NEOID|nr:pH-response regulator protein palI/prr-5 [Neolecta irregularis DAH-3]|eukprot:OLL22015.1 pH-response regulator protein palI/prr-5 [Neolecta irregularis DAH-3]